MNKVIMILVVSISLFSCTSAKISSELASGVIGCSPGEITILNETATWPEGMHNFEAICKGKRFICTYQATAGINCKEALGDTAEDTTEKTMMDRNAVYDALKNGVVKDTETGLEWKLAPNRDVTWNQAKSWIQKPKLGGGGWRMPTEDELKRLYREGVLPRNITLLLIADGWAVWSVETKGSEARYVYFVEAGEGYWYERDNSGGMRAIAVRSLGDS